jgi:membrane fusion protein, heavy metal efflux system
MNNKYCIWPMAALLALMLVACGEDAHEPHGHGHDDTHSAAVDVQKGPHNGRLLTDGDLTVELALVESGAAPEYRAWVTDGGVPVPPEAVTLSVTLTRLDGEKEQFQFLADEDFLRGDGVVTEPHSFDVSVVAAYQGEDYRWTYESHEGRVTIAADSAEAAGIVVEHAGPRVIHDTLPLYGRLVINPDAVREVGARYGGEVMSVPKTVGDTVKAGETLARVEANDSLQAYSVTAPIAGVITARMTNPGEQVGDAPLFIVSDLTQVWAELSVFPRDLARIELGQSVRLSEVDGGRSVTGKIIRIAPSGSSAHQALKVWARLDAGQGGWTPGLYVNAEVVIGGAEVPLAVKTAGLQAFRDFTVVFTQVEDTYEARMLELGRSDGAYVEVLGGLKPGAPYVTENSYLIKADIEKSGASHDH